MAKFRNIDKRRSRITGIKKISQLAQPQTAQVDPLGEVGKALEEYYSAHPMVADLMVAAQSQTAQEEKSEPSWADVFDLAHFRFRMFFAWLWVSIRYKPYYAWLCLISANHEQSRP